MLPFLLDAQLGCRLAMFARAFSLQSVANMCVCIAFYRMMSGRRVSPPRVGCSIAFAWLLAAILASPQLFVWQTTSTTLCHNVTWVQCVTVWGELPSSNVPSARGRRALIAYQFYRLTAHNCCSLVAVALTISATEREQKQPMSFLCIQLRVAANHRY